MVIGPTNVESGEVWLKGFEFRVREDGARGETAVAEEAKDRAEARADGGGVSRGEVLNGAEPELGSVGDQEGEAINEHDVDGEDGGRAGLEDTRWNGGSGLSRGEGGASGCFAME